MLTKLTDDSGCQRSRLFLLQLSTALIYLLLLLIEALSSIGSLDTTLAFLSVSKHFFTPTLPQALLSYLIYQIASDLVFLIPLLSSTDYPLHNRWSDS